MDGDQTKTKLKAVSCCRGLVRFNTLKATAPNTESWSAFSFRIIKRPAEGNPRTGRPPGCSFSSENANTSTFPSYLLAASDHLQRYGDRWRSLRGTTRVHLWVSAVALFGSPVLHATIPRGQTGTATAGEFHMGGLSCSSGHIAFSASISCAASDSSAIARVLRFPEQKRARPLFLLPVVQKNLPRRRLYIYGTLTNERLSPKSPRGLQVGV